MRLFAALVVTAAVLAEPVRPGWLGFGYTRHVNDPEQWLTVQFVVPGSPAALAGLRQGDLITALNGKRIRFADDVAMLEWMATIRPGKRVTVSVVRGQQRFKRTLKAATMTDQQYERWKMNVEHARQRLQQP